MSLPEATNAAQQTDDADLSGRQVAGFRLLRRLGRGAMAEVYLADQASLARQVAVKILKSKLAADETYVRRFQNEARAAAALVHANIVQIYEVGSVDGLHYIAQEYVQGQNLQELMTRRGPPALSDALAIMRQVASALNKAATAGIIHRDIKPENILLARTGEAKVADFGLARIATPGMTPDLTQVGVTMGTPLYMSPEQVEGRPLDPRSDIYSFGVTCYQMLAGVVPFRGDTVLSVAVQHLHSQPEPLERLRPDLPAELCRIVHRMLAKGPDERYTTARELLVDLRGLQPAGDAQTDFDLGEPEYAAVRLATERLSALSRTVAMQAPRLRRRRAWLAAGVCLALAGGAAAGWMTRPPFLLNQTGPAAVTRQRTAQEQLYFAKLQGSETWLRSVEEFFPEAEYEVRMARQELARWYLYHGRWDDARRLFDQFASLEDPAGRAFGLAGQAIVLAKQRQFDESAERLAEFWPLHDKLDDVHLTRLLRATFQADRRASQANLNQQDTEAIKQWLEEDLRVDAAVDSEAGVR
ncbi:MAG TPA: serine/threonine-protein kinase [Pirellulales bacterium]|nr:serine/threonine-protein kinase [Pirellulales bacterium]